MSDTKSLIEKYQEMDSFNGISLVRFDQQGNDEDTPLHIACYRGDEADLIAMLKTGVNVNVRGDLGNTPLHNAVVKNRKRIAEILLEAGADPTIENDYGDTAIVYASKGDSSEMKDILQKHV